MEVSSSREARTLWTWGVFFEIYIITHNRAQNVGGWVHLPIRPPVNSKYLPSPSLKNHSKKCESEGGGCARWKEKSEFQVYIPPGSMEEIIAPRALPILTYRECSSWLGGDTIDPDLPRVPEKLCPRLVVGVGPELETIVVVDGCLSWIVVLEGWVEVDVDGCFDIWLSRSMSIAALFSGRGFCFSSLILRLRSSSSFFASVLALEKPCRGAKLQLGAAPARGLLPAPVVWGRGTAVSEDDEEGSGVLLVFDESERGGRGETRPLEVSRLVRDSGKWLADIFGKEDDIAESRRRSCKRVRSTPPSGFRTKGERVENEASPSREEDACWTCCDCERVADLGGEVSEASADTLTDKGLVYISGFEPDRTRRWSR